MNKEYDDSEFELELEIVDLWIHTYFGSGQISFSFFVKMSILWNGRETMRDTYRSQNFIGLILRFNLLTYFREHINYVQIATKENYLQI